MFKPHERFNQLGSPGVSEWVPAWLREGASDWVTEWRDYPRPDSWTDWLTDLLTYGLARVSELLTCSHLVGRSGNGAEWKPAWLHSSSKSHPHLVLKTLTSQGLTALRVLLVSPSDSFPSCSEWISRTCPRRTSHRRRTANRRWQTRPRQIWDGW